MIHLGVNPRDPETDAVAQAARVVADGGLVVYPTDTLYGLGADPGNDAAIERLFAAKGRPGGQPIPLIAGGLLQVEQTVGRLTPLARRLAGQFWPGPLTLVVEASPRISPLVHRGTGRVAVRVPDHAVARVLADACEHAITSTSANLSGQPAVDIADRLPSALIERVDLVLDAGPTPGGLPSTIVDVTGERPVLVREGVVPWVRVLKCV